MDMQQAQTLPPPPGVIGSLRAGFDTIATNISAILLPMTLDILLWLGPRLRVDELYQLSLAGMIRFFSSSNIPSSELNTLRESGNQVLEVLQGYNLLSLLRTFPIGVFSLMSGNMPVLTPFGEPSTIQVDSFLTLVGWIGLLTFAGWITGGLFFEWVSRVVSDPSQREGPGFGHPVFNTGLLSMFWIIFAFVVGLPVLVILAITSSINAFFGQVLLILVSLLAVWLIVPAFFMPHGIFLRKQNAFTSIGASFRMARFTVPTSSLFVLSALLISYGLNFLWNIPSTGSWMTMVGILGHAFVTTSLLAASFIYYRDLNSWLQTVLEKLQSNSPTQQA